MKIQSYLEKHMKQVELKAKMQKELKKLSPFGIHLHTTHLMRFIF